MQIQKVARRAALLASISAIAVASMPGLAAAQSTEVDELIVTATRRDATVQDVPINIAAVGGMEIQKQGLNDLSELANFILASIWWTRADAPRTGSSSGA